MFEHGVWDNLNLFFWTMATYICLQNKLSLLSTEETAMFSPNTDTF